MTRSLPETVKVTTEAFVSLARTVKTMYPCHADALMGELVGTRMTNERWSRVNNILASFHCIPGVGLRGREHDVRNTVFSSIKLAQRMLQLTFKEQGSDYDFEMIDAWRLELEERIKTIANEGTVA